MNSRIVGCSSLGICYEYNEDKLHLVKFKSSQCFFHLHQSNSMVPKLTLRLKTCYIAKLGYFHLRT